MGHGFKKIKDKIKGAADTNKNPRELAEEALFLAFWIFAVILIIVAILDLRLNLTPCFYLFTGDLDSARYLLSAIAQAQAAIIALVVTLTLVAVQLASQSYSPRVMDLFRSFRNYPFWLLLLLYFVSIMYDVVVLGTLNKINDVLPENRISFAVFLTGFAIAALIPYTRNVINNLKPENVIRQIIAKIDRKQFVEKVKKEMEATIREEGEKAVFDVGLHGIHPEIVKLLGRLKYRTSYGQNVLQHSKEVAYIMGIMASELRLDFNLAKRIGLLHDIGKAVSHEVEGTHAKIGADLARKYNEPESVIHSIEAHHEDIEARTL